MNNIDYKNYDTLEICIDKDMFEEIIQIYSTFKWELIEKSKEKKFKKTINLKFIRPHNVDNKDILQLKQVYIEEKINQENKLTKLKRLKSLILSFIDYFVITILGLYGLININTTKIASIICLSLSGILILTQIILYPLIRKKEIKNFEIKDKKINNEIKDILLEVKEISKDNNEKKTK